MVRHTSELHRIASFRLKAALISIAGDNPSAPKMRPNSSASNAGTNAIHSSEGRSRRSSNEDEASVVATKHEVGGLRETVLSLREAGARLAPDVHPLPTSLHLKNEGNPLAC